MFNTAFCFFSLFFFTIIILLSSTWFLVLYTIFTLNPSKREFQDWFPFSTLTFLIKFIKQPSNYPHSHLIKKRFICKIKMKSTFGIQHNVLMMMYSTLPLWFFCWFCTKSICTASFRHLITFQVEKVWWLVGRYVIIIVIEKV